MFPLCKEAVTGEMYQNIHQIFRYYINCTQCSRRISIKEVYGDSHHDEGCLVEFGATRLSHFDKPLYMKRDKRGPRFIIVNDTLELKEGWKEKLMNESEPNKPIIIESETAKGYYEIMHDGSKE